MLNQDSLNQLKGLKSRMEAEKERADAVIKGTQSRYGFAVLDDGREVFLPPDEMLKAFPQDRVRVCIRPGDKGKTVGEVEKLLDSPLGTFTGRCVTKGKAVFVQPDLPHFNRWLFIPPHARNGVKAGDYISCAVLRHPIRDGRPQAKVLAVLGDDSTPGVENAYCVSKYQLPREWSQAARRELSDILATPPPVEKPRQDLTALEFVSIDSAKTLDIDDALYAESSGMGWNLYVAVADPTHYIPPGSALEQEIARRGTSVYFHGDAVPMLPEQLSQEICALGEGVDHLALVCRMSVSEDGRIGEFEFIEAVIRSRAKLSYFAVDRYLSGSNDDLMSHASPLEALYQMYRALRAFREEHELVMEDRCEYRWILNDARQIETIEPGEKLQSQKLVEECMVAANRCAARFLVEKGCSGPFVCHPGFRNDRLDEARQFLDRRAPALASHDLHARQDYREVMHHLAAANDELPLRAMVNRLLTRSTLSTTSGSHMGMSLDCYTNCTSPLRKYLDFLVHRQIKSVLEGGQGDLVAPPMLEELATCLARARNATQEAERWLGGNYLKRLTRDEPGREFPATVRHINSSGFFVRLEENGLEGFVDLRRDAEKFSYDKWTASLTSTTRRFQLEQKVKVVLDNIEAGTHQALFQPAEGCGLK